MPRSRIRHRAAARCLREEFCVEDVLKPGSADQLLAAILTSSSESQAKSQRRPRIVAVCNAPQAWPEGQGHDEQRARERLREPAGEGWDHQYRLCGIRGPPAPVSGRRASQPAPKAFTAFLMARFLRAHDKKGTATLTRSGQGNPSGCDGCGLPGRLLAPWRPGDLALNSGPCPGPGHFAAGVESQLQFQ